MSRRVVVPVAFLAVALIIAACESSPSPSPSVAASGTAAPTPAPPPAEGRLALVQERGMLICGINGSLPGFSFLDSATGETTGFDADFCRAVAAAVLGDPTLVEFRPLNADARGPALQSQEIDVLIRNTTWTVTRDTDWGLFAPTTFYDGQGMMVREADGIESLADLEGATICVQTGTTTELNLADVFGAEGIDYTPLPFGEIEQTYSAYDEGSCDAVTSDRSQLIAQRTTFSNPDDHVILEVVMSKEPLGPVVPHGDEAWFNVVKWVVFATFEAEERGITQDNVAQLVGSDNPVIARLLGADGDLGLRLDADWVVNVISAVGNYGEIYDRNLGPGTPFDLARGPNSLWTDGGLLYAPPYR
ncbi:MAG: amino acid ABC transporter substrate-binding protein [Candidatus Limnocylindria bacterium]